VPLQGAEVVVGGRSQITDEAGVARVIVTPGTVEVVVVKAGFLSATTRVTVSAGQVLPVLIQLQPVTQFEEDVTVSATRTGRRIDDQPMRVEVLGLEEIEEKQLMTPGDIVMLLNEMGGMRVQSTSPSLGAASVRVQGLRGRYTRILSDGLPLFGDVGGLGLLQIPPSDLGRVEVIKGAASALYGAGALGGVVDLISKQPGDTAERQVLFNQTSNGGTDALFFSSEPLTPTWRATTLVGGHWQGRRDLDDDGWGDVAGYSRGVVRPRVFWDGGGGRSFFGTVGLTRENRDGGTMPGRTLAATGAPFGEALDTTRADAGLVAQTSVGGEYVLTARASATRSTQTHQLGAVSERRRQHTLFGELAIRGRAPRQTWVVGMAAERAGLDTGVRSDLDYTYSAPGVFVQDDVDITSWLLVSASGRIDRHSQFGTFVSPRFSALVRGAAWHARVSVGGGFFAPSPLTDETEAAGLSRLDVTLPLKAERGRSASLDLTRRAGPVTVTTTLFRYEIRDPLVLDRATYRLSNLDRPTITRGGEVVATLRQGPIHVTGTYTFVDSREGVGDERGELALTPRHSAGFVASDGSAASVG
jgi:iron complex outermembrane receptor protein